MYSCFQKNTKSNHHSLGPIGAIWLRLLMTTVYNAYHAFNLAGTADFLASNECKSFAHFQDKRRKRQPFRQFCMMLADDMVGRLKVTAPSVFDSSSSGEEEVQTSNEDEAFVVQRTILYNKRDAYFNIPELIHRQKNRRVAHVPTRNLTQKVVFGAVDAITLILEKNIACMEGRLCGIVTLSAYHSAK